MVATGSQDKTCKLWDKDLNLVTTLRNIVNIRLHNCLALSLFLGSTSKTATYQKCDLVPLLIVKFGSFF